MTHGKRRHPGTVTLFALLVLVLSARLFLTVQRVLVCRLENQALVQRAGQRSELLRSFCKAWQDQPLLAPRSEAALPEVFFHTGKRSVSLLVETDAPRAGICQMERVTVFEGGERTPYYATRYEIVPPGGASHPAYGGGAGEDVPFPPFQEGFFSEFTQGVHSVPAKDWPHSPLAGHLYQPAGSPAVLSGSEPWQGRAFLLCPSGLVLSGGFSARGLYWIFCRGDVTIGDNVCLDRAFLFATGRINVGKKTQIHGIMAAGGQVVLAEGAQVIRDASVLEPYRTPYSYK